MKSVSIDSGALAVPEPDASGVRVYKGIPYAAPPIGPLRWRPPEPVPSWAGVRPSNVFGPNSLQGVVWDDIDPLAAGVSEDCLFLNVWTPAAPGDGARLATMVWIHGGGFVAGSGAEPRYDGAHVAARGIIVVTVNHRLNALGFLAHPDLTAESDHRASGNYGLLDLVAALGWVKRNIAAFGGDPAKVALAGESAGSFAASALMASPLAKGLFSRVIGESGALFPSPIRGPEFSPKPRRPVSTSCARWGRSPWRSCARLLLTPSSPPGPDSEPVRSSMGGFSPARRPRSSPQASKAMCR